MKQTVFALPPNLPTPSAKTTLASPELTRNLTKLQSTLRVHFLALITTMVAMNTMMVSIVALLK
jgi:hypothetical protein